MKAGQFSPRLYYRGKAADALASENREPLGSFGQGGTSKNVQR